MTHRIKNCSLREMGNVVLTEFYKQATRPTAMQVKSDGYYCNPLHIVCRVVHYPLSYGVPVRERYGSTLLPATREQHDQNCTQSH